MTSIELEALSQEYTAPMERLRSGDVDPQKNVDLSPGSRWMSSMILMDLSPAAIMPPPHPSVLNTAMNWSNEYIVNEWPLTATDRTSEWPDVIDALASETYVSGPSVYSFKGGMLRTRDLAGNATALLKQRNPLLVRLGGVGGGLVVRTTTATLTNWLLNSASPFTAQIVAPKKRFMPGSKIRGSRGVPFPKGIGQWIEWYKKSMIVGLDSKLWNSSMLLPYFGIPWFFCGKSGFQWSKAGYDKVLDAIDLAVELFDLEESVATSKVLRGNVVGSKLEPFSGLLNLPGMGGIKTKVKVAHSKDLLTTTTIPKGFNPHALTMVSGCLLNLAVTNMLTSYVIGFVNGKHAWFEAWMEGLEYAPGLVTSTWFFVLLAVVWNVMYNTCIDSRLWDAIAEAMLWYGLPDATVAALLGQSFNLYLARALEELDLHSDLAPWRKGISKGRKGLVVTASTISGSDDLAVMTNVVFTPPGGVDSILDMCAQLGYVVGEEDDYKFERCE